MGDAGENEGSGRGRIDSRGEAEARRALGRALASYERSRAPRELERAFEAAAAVVAMRRGERANEPADAGEAKRLMAELHEFERLVAAAVGEMEQAAHAGAARLWEWFGLRSAPPRWTDPERSAARVIVASACVPLKGRGADWLRPRMMRLAAERWAAQLVGELRAADESLWQRALGGRYDSVRSRYAPRTKRRVGELSGLLAKDERPLEALQRRLSRWLAEDRDFDGLPSELETAFVQTRTPIRLA